MIDWLENVVNKCAKSSKICIKMVSAGKGGVYLEGVYSEGGLIIGRFTVLPIREPYIPTFTVFYAKI